jgi:hypothetical protein
MRSDAEFHLHCAVVQHLRLAALPGVFYFHPANGEARSARTGAKLKRMGTRPGVPDLVVIVGGIAHGLELKAHGGRQSPSQKLAQKDWERAGGAYEVADGINTALAALVRWKALPEGYGWTSPKRQQTALALEAA